jgi:hypothetical protein
MFTTHSAKKGKAKWVKRELPVHKAPTLSGIA